MVGWINELVFYLVVYILKLLFIYKQAHLCTNSFYAFFESKFYCMPFYLLKICIMIHNFTKMTQDWQIKTKSQTSFLSPYYSIIWCTSYFIYIHAGIISAQFPSKGQRQSGRASPAHLIRPITDYQTDFQWGSGGHAQHPVRISPGNKVTILYNLILITQYSIHQ